MKKYIISSFVAVIFSSTVCLAEPCDKLFSAARTNYACLIPLIFDAQEVSQCLLVSRWTPLHEAVFFGSYESVARLIPLMIQNGFGIESREGNGHTPMDLAYLKGHQHIVQLLFMSGARQ